MSVFGNKKFNLRIATILAVLLVGTSACGSGSGKRAGEFDIYLSRFEESFAKYQGINIQARYITIQRGTLDRTQLAYCTLTYVSAPSITVNDVYWDGLSSEVKEIVMFHELGHCVLHRKHNNRVGSGRLLESIMDQRPEGLRDYSLHRDDYLRELFLSTVSTPDDL